ncbi:MAG: ABC transporter substrate-binding protein, partial [Actinobacteria bacterium]|nr:ABC transporter substrate-binding protein [Actinomycetota bacterium]
MTRTAGRRRVAGALFAMAALAACGSGDSILQAGNDRPPTTTVPITTPPSTVPGQTTLPPETTAPPTTLPRPIDSLPPCDVDVLDEASASGPVELLFWHGLSNENGRTIERVVDEYNQSQDRVRVQLEFQGGYEQTIDKYLQSNTDNRPDVVQLPEYATQLMIDTQSAVPVQACMEDAGFDASPLLPSALRAYATEGVQWSMPFNLSNPVLFYNKKIFRDAGLDPEQPPLTLAEVAQTGQAIQQTGAAAFGLVVDTAPDGGGGWFLEQWLAKEGELYSDNDNGRLAPSTRVLFDGPQAVALLTELRDVINNGGGAYVGENPSGQDSFLKMADTSAQGTMTIASSASLGPVLQFVEGGIIPGITKEDIGVGPMPSPNGGPGALIGGNSLWISDHDDVRAAAAWDFVSWLVSAEVQSDFAASTGYVPINSGALDLEP